MVLIDQNVFNEIDILMFVKWCDESFPFSLVVIFCVGVVLGCQNPCHC